jgi:DegV family protein with EDD domain
VPATERENPLRFSEVKPPGLYRTERNYQEDLMTNQVAIVTDSTAYLPTPVLEEYAIKVVPLVVIWDGATYQDGVDITTVEFYNRLSTSSTLPSTSQPPIEAFKGTFQTLLEQGKDVAAILISSGISGTVNAALQAKAALGSDRIEIVDSQTAGMATGLHVIAAARKAAAGGTLGEVAEVARQAQARTDVVFAVNTLEFLHKGGRIGGAKRFLGSMLNIKPILQMKDGKIDAADQARTQKRALERLMEIIEERAGADKPLRMAVMHSNVPDQAQDFVEVIQARFKPEEIHLAELSPVIGTHVGPGTLAITCLHGM